MTDPEAVIFDLDGVISRTEFKHSEAKIEILKKWVGEVDISVEEVTKQYAGVASETFYRDMFEKYGLDYNTGDCRKAAEQKRDAVEALIQQEGIDPVKGSIQLIESLHERGYRLAIASQSPEEHIENVVNCLKIGQFFEGFTSAKEVEKGKPEPDVYEKAAERLDVKTEKCVAIEDTTAGIKSAKSAGMVCIGLQEDSSGTGDADYLTHSLAELDPEKIVDIYRNSH